MIHLIRLSLGLLGLAISGALLIAIETLCRIFSPPAVIAAPIVLFIIYTAGTSIHETWTEGNHE